MNTTQNNASNIMNLDYEARGLDICAYCAKKYNVGERIPRIPAEAVINPTLSLGDVTIHHARTLHGASANRSPDQSRRAISIRYCGDDARYHIREGAPLKPHHTTIREGDPLTHERCPKVWPLA